MPSLLSTYSIYCQFIVFSLLLWAYYSAGRKTSNAGAAARFCMMAQQQLDVKENRQQQTLHDPYRWFRGAAVRDHKYVMFITIVFHHSPMVGAMLAFLSSPWIVATTLHGLKHPLLQFLRGCMFMECFHSKIYTSRSCRKYAAAFFTAYSSLIY